MGMVGIIVRSTWVFYCCWTCETDLWYISQCCLITKQKQKQKVNSYFTIAIQSSTLSCAVLGH